MKKTIVFLVLFILSISCTKEKIAVTKGFSTNQLLLQKEYIGMDSVLRFSVDSLGTLLKKMELQAKNEPAKYKAMVNIGYGWYYLNKSSYELALKHYENALKGLKHSKEDTLIARAYNGVGNYCKNTGDYQKGLSCVFKALKIFEANKNRKGIVSSNALIGQIYMQKNDMELAKAHLQIAMKTLRNNKHQANYLNAAHMLANIYGISGDYKNALRIDEEGLRISDSLNSPKIKVTFLDNKANCLMYSNQLDSAQYYFNECLKIDKTTGDLKQVADSYSNLAQLEIFRKNFPEAETLAKRSIRILDSIDSKPNLLKSYNILTEVYKGWERFPEALQTEEIFLEVYQKMMTEKKEASIAEFKIVYETEQKEKTIAQNRIALLEKEREVRQRNYLLIGISVLAFFIALTGFLIYRQQKLKNRQQQQEHELKTAISKIETQNELQEQRLSISRDLHDNIGAQLTFIISSVDNIRYAFDLKDTKLETRLQSINNFTKSTIIELRDTIWAMNHNEITFEDLRIRIFNFIEKAKDAREEIEFQFEIDPELKLLKLTSLSGMNIYRTIQEAINNAIKYSGATQISVFIKSEMDSIKIVISDNGTGFDTTAEKGNGIRNMRKRIEDIDGTFELISKPATGTTIAIYLPLNVNSK